MKPDPLDFDPISDQQPVSVLDAVSRILEHFGGGGATTEDIGAIFSKGCPQWSAGSYSPGISILIALGLAREERRFGVRRIYHVRRYDHDTDRQRYNEMSRRKKADTRAAKEARDGIKPPAQLQLAAVSSPMKMMLAIGEKETFVCTVEQARDLWRQLDGIFGRKN